MADVYKILQNIILDGAHFEQGLVVDLTNLEEKVVDGLVKRGIIEKTGDDTTSEVDGAAPLGNQSQPKDLPDQPAPVTDRVTPEEAAQTASNQQPTQEQIDQDLEDTAVSTTPPETEQQI